MVEGGKALEAPVGTLLGGRYRIQSTLGAGGMAVVYGAEDAILGRNVALKTLHPRYAEVPSFRRRFLQEARAMACLDHENIVRVYDISQDGEAPFIVAECVPGRDLGTLLGGRRARHLNERFVRRRARGTGSGARSWAAPATCPPSSSWARRRPPAATSTPSASSSTTASPAWPPPPAASGTSPDNTPTRTLRRRAS